MKYVLFSSSSYDCGGYLSSFARRIIIGALFSRPLPTLICGTQTSILISQVMMQNLDLSFTPNCVSSLCDHSNTNFKLWHAKFKIRRLLMYLWWWEGGWTNYNSSCKPRYATISGSEALSLQRPREFSIRHHLLLRDASCSNWPFEAFSHFRTFGTFARRNFCSFCHSAVAVYSGSSAL